MAVDYIEGYQKLATAIVVNAIVDYRKEAIALKRQIKRIEEGLEKVPVKFKRKNGTDTHAEELLDIERFFYSGWFYMLADVDGPILLEKLHEELDITTELIRSQYVKECKTRREALR